MELLIDVPQSFKKRHPAKYTDALFPVFIRMLRGRRRILDPFSGLRHVCFVPAEFVGLHRSHGDLVKAVEYIRSQAPGLTMRKVEML